MSNKSDLVRLIRRTQTTVSIIMFFIVMAFCWSVADYNINEIQLSYWGNVDKFEYGWLWNSIIVLLSLSIFFNNIFFIKNHSRITYKFIPYISFSIVAVSLFLVGVFNITYGLLHDIPAWFYFFSYPLSIFMMSHLNRKILLYKEWFTHLIFSIVMIVLPLVLLGFFPGFGISEIIHSIVVCVWNIHVAFKRFDITLTTTK